MYDKLDISHILWILYIIALENCKSSEGKFSDFITHFFFNKYSTVEGKRSASLSHVRMSSQSSFEIKSTVKVFEGSLIRFCHYSPSNQCTMTAAVFIPNGMADARFPCILYLSGLTCTDENVCQKSGCFKTLSESKVRKLLYI
jgi:hypothetical protein